jgi:hypothetical protein
MWNPNWFITLLLINLNILYAQENITYNLADRLYDQSNLMVLPYDEWGFNGTLQLFDLPSSVVKFHYNQMSYNDPLYGQLPLSWYNPRLTSLSTTSSIHQCDFHLLWPDSGQTRSAFDYYKGDYHFLNFAFSFASQMGPKTIWRFWAEDLAFDGVFGFYGPEISKSGESLSQSYQLDIQTLYPTSKIELGVSYQKYQIGSIYPSQETFEDGIGYIGWQQAGQFRESRTNAYLKFETRTTRPLHTGFQVTNFDYTNRSTQNLLAMQAEANQFSGFVHKTICTTRPLDIILFIEPSVQRTFFQSESEIAQPLLKIGSIATLASSRYKFNFNLGLSNHNFKGTFKGTLKIAPGLLISAEINHDYALYPAIYQFNAGPENPFSDHQGFLFTIYQAEFSYQKQWLNLSLNLNSVCSDFFIPSRKTALDETPTFLEQKYRESHLIPEFDLKFPWMTAIKGRAILLLDPDIQNHLNFQGWVQLRQDVGLFNNNLHLYLAGDLIYRRGGELLAWFQEYRSVGYCSLPYFTNERLNLNLRIGARVSSFHIFYAVYNVEGRQFSILPLIPTQYRLKLLGIEWSFLD